VYYFEGIAPPVVVHSGEANERQRIEEGQWKDRKGRSIPSVWRYKLKVGRLWPLWPRRVLSFAFYMDLDTNQYELFESGDSRTTISFDIGKDLVDVRDFIQRLDTKIQGYKSAVNLVDIF
jgi:hypothetical protein